MRNAPVTMNPARASARVAVDRPPRTGRDGRRRRLHVRGRLDDVDERRRVVAHVARARGWAVRYASRSRVGDTCV